jgi:hypothetical protein
MSENNEKEVLKTYEKYTVFYTFTKTNKSWKIYAISDVILD